MGADHPRPLPGGHEDTLIAEKAMPGQRNNRVGQRTSRLDEPVLFGPRATALNQNNENDNDQHTGNNPNNRGRTHENSSFLRQEWLMHSHAGVESE
jgi:hypothetical protein